MYISGRFKLIRKHDCDFWNMSYYRLTENKWFLYFKYSLIHKIKQNNLNKFFKICRKKRRPVQILQLSNIGKRARGFFNPFLNIVDDKFLYHHDKKYRFRRFKVRRKIQPGKIRKKKVRPNLSYYHLFIRRSLRYVRFLYRRAYYKRDMISQDLLLGVKTPFRLYKPPFHRKFIEKRLFFQRIMLFYNNFDKLKLKRFGKLGRKGQAGGINFFFYLLESRIDSVLLRFNLASKFVLREVILSNKVLVDNKTVSYFNFIVPKNSFVHFVPKFKRIIYYNLKRKITRKMFHVQPPIYFEINYRTLIILIVPKLIDPIFVSFPFFDANSKFVSGLHTVLWGF